MVARSALHCPSYGLGEDMRIAKAGDAGSTVFVDQDVCLFREAYVNCAERVYGMDGGRTVWRSSWTTPRSCIHFKHRTISVSCCREASAG